MKKIVWPILALLLFLAACQPRPISIPISTPISVTILDGEQILSLSTTKTIPKEILAEANITLGTNDRLLYLGSSTPLDTALPDAKSYVLTIRRAVALTVVTPDGQQTIQTSALTVGQALAEAGYALYASDLLDPPAETSITGPLTVTYQPGHEIVITVDGTQVRVRSMATTVGQALAEAGVPLVGLDYSLPDESAPLPEDGQIRIMRVVESVTLTQRTIPFNTRTELSADVELDHQELVQGGEPGLAIARTRTRSEDGVQVSQKSESESIVRPPQDSIMGIGTKIVIRTTTVDGVTFEYYRVLRMYATSYSPCRSLTPSGNCSYGTSSGMPAQKGIVAFQYYWYLLFGFDHLYIPGYGFATVGDVGGSNLTSHYWLDLGYNDNDYVPWAQWVTVYFLPPVPANPGYILP
jgi:resuscitation-promoting factor RpfB